MSERINPILLDIPAELAGERIHLRAVGPRDGAIMCPSVRDSLAELKLWMPWAVDDYSEARAEEWCRKSAAEFLARNQLQYLILLRDDNRHVGTIGAFNFNWDVPSGEIGYWLHTAHTGRGLMTESVKTLTEMLLNSHGFNRIWIRTDQRNVKSRRVAELSNFQLEGILRHECLATDGCLRNTCIYSKIPSLKNEVENKGVGSL